MIYFDVEISLARANAIGNIVKNKQKKYDVEVIIFFQDEIGYGHYAGQIEFDAVTFVSEPKFRLYVKEKYPVEHVYEKKIFKMVLTQEDYQNNCITFSGEERLLALIVLYGLQGITNGEYETMEELFIDGSNEYIVQFSHYVKDDATILQLINAHPGLADVQ